MIEREVRSKKALSRHLTGARDRKEKNKPFLDLENDSEKIIEQSHSAVERNQTGLQN